jgi:hypothetical protein
VITVPPAGLHTAVATRSARIDLIPHVTMGRGSPGLCSRVGEFAPAEILGRFGAVPDDLSEL